MRQHWALLLTGLAGLAFFVRDRFRRAAAWHPRLAAVPALLTLLLAGVFVEQAKKDGESVHAAARICFAGHGGQTVMSSAVQAAVVDSRAE